MNHTISDEDSPEPGSYGSDDASAGVVAALHKDVAWAELTNTPLPHRELGRFLVHGFLGRGGMGMVFEAQDETLGRPVALKLLRRRDPGHRARARMLREARALARLSHPNVVQIYDTGIIEGCPFIAMELARGQTLAQWQGAEPRPWRSVVQHYLDAGRGLAAAHAQGLVHRDFKPHNCIVEEDGQVRVLDFGLARDVGLPSSPSDSVTGNSEAGSAPLTKAGSLMGTLLYMAPEQLQRKSADARSDQFSFCVALFEALCGQRPFHAETVEALTVAQREPLTWPGRSGDHRPPPPWLVAVVSRGLALDPQRRHPDMTALLGALERGLRRRTRLHLGLAGSALLSVGAFTAALWPAEQPCEGLTHASAPGWTSRQRAELETAMQAETDAGGRAWQRLAPILDAYASDWVEQRAEACDAHFEQRTIGAGGYERRTACLDTRMIHFRALVDAVSRTDDAGRAHAPVAAAGLPSLHPCAETQRLLDGPPPAPAQIAGSVAEQRRALASARARGRLGEHRAALTQTHQIVSRAAALDHAPLHAEALAERGWLRVQTRQFDRADTDLSAALTLAESSRDDDTAFTVLMSLADLAAQVERATAADAWVRQARAKLARLGNDPVRTMELRRREGKVALLHRDYPLAIDAFTEVLAWHQDAPPGSHVDLVRSHLDLASAYDLSGRHRPAIEHYEAGLEVADEALGAHVNTANLHLDLATLHARLGHDEIARTQYEQALAIYEQSAGEATPMVVVAEIGLTQLALVTGELDDARAHAAKASAALDASRTGLIDAPQRADVLGVLGSVAQLQGSYELAIGRYLRAIDAWDEVPDADPVWRALLVSNVGECRLGQGRFQAAHDQFSAALGRLEPALGPKDVMLSYPMRGLGEAELELGHPERARPLLRRALELREAEPGDIDNLASIQWALARATTDPTRAVALAKEAREGFEALGPLGQQRTNTINRWLTGKEADP